MRQLFSNVIGNAIKSPRGWARHGARGAWSRERWVRRRGHGRGHPAAQLPHVFERFISGGRRGPLRTTRAGLGLPIARGIVEAHRGTDLDRECARRGTTCVSPCPSRALRCNDAPRAGETPREVRGYSRRVGRRAGRCSIMRLSPDTSTSPRHAAPCQAWTRDRAVHRATSYSVALHDERAGRRLPFAPGERLTFRGKVSTGLGRGTLWVEGPVSCAARAPGCLHSDRRGASDRCVPRIAPRRGSTRSDDRAPLHRAPSATSCRSTDDAVNIFADEKRWRAESGAEGPTPTGAPLDELSFLYTCARSHWTRTRRSPSPATSKGPRNPTVLRVTGREEIQVGAGGSAPWWWRCACAIRAFKGEGSSDHSSDDACRPSSCLDSRVPTPVRPRSRCSRFEGVRPGGAAKIG